MKILVDENIANITVQRLRTMGHDVLEIRGTARQGMTDEDLWPLALAENRLLITTDKGFCGHRADPHCGILVVRLRQPNARGIHNRVMAAFRQTVERDRPGLLVVMRDSVKSVHRA